MPAPPLPFLPADAHGKLIVLATLVYAGDIEAGERALAPFRKLATPLVDMLKPMRYREIYQPEQKGYHPVATSRTMFVDTIDRSIAATILDHLKALNGPMPIAQLRVLGGAMARIPVDATAFGHRTSRIMVNVFALYEKSAEKESHETWANDFAAALRQNDGGAYVNFLADGDRAQVRAAYPGETWERLAAIKYRYDPTNLFRLNHNIPPARRL